MHSVKAKIHQNLISETIRRSPSSLRICICVCICICACICICCLTICIFVLAFALQFVVAHVFLSTPKSRHWFVELYFSQPDFVFVTGSLICISHGLTSYFSPKCFISQSGIIPEPAVRFAFSKGQNPSESNFPNHGHVV